MEIRPDLSICLLPEYDGADLGPCLAALFACADPLSLEIFIPHGADCGEFQENPRLHFLEQPSIPASSFVGKVWQCGQGRYMAVWNSGVMATPASLITLVEFLDDHPDVAVVGPRFFDGTGEILATAFECRQVLPFSDPVMTGWDGLSTMEVDWLSGAALVASRLALEDIRFPLSDFGGSWERCLCQRLQKEGWHIFFVHLARVVSAQRYCEPGTLWQRLTEEWLRWVARLALGSFPDK